MNNYDYIVNSILNEENHQTISGEKLNFNGPVDVLQAVKADKISVNDALHVMRSQFSDKSMIRPDQYNRIVDAIKKTANKELAGDSFKRYSKGTTVIYLDQKEKEHYAQIMEVLPGDNYVISLLNKGEGGKELKVGEEEIHSLEEGTSITAPNGVVANGIYGKAVVGGETGGVQSRNTQIALKKKEKKLSKKLGTFKNHVVPHTSNTDIQRGD
jgi:hypothetical protein